MSEPQEALQEQVEGLAEGFSGIAGIAAVNLDTDAEVFVNDSESFPTASSIKIFILYELMRQHLRGNARLWERMTLREADKTPGSGMLHDFLAGINLTLHDLAVMMMGISDNTATNMLIGRLGVGGINGAIREAGLFDTELRGPIDFDRIREDNNNLALSTPRDFVTFLRVLYRGELIAGGMVEEMLDIMRIQKNIEPLRRYLPFNPYAREFGEPETMWVASKTGSLRGVRCESGLIHTEPATWAISVMSKEGQDQNWTSDNEGVRLISAVSRCVYEAWGPPLGA